MKKKPSDRSRIPPSPCLPGGKPEKDGNVEWQRILVHGSRDGIVVIDTQGAVHDANKKFAETLGYSLKEIFDLYVWDWDHHYEKEKILEMLETVDEHGHHFETRHLRKDGSLVDVEICTNAAVFQGEKLIFCVCRDITDRINAQAALLESEARLAALSDASFESIFLSEQGICTDQNLTAERMFGYTRQEAIGRPGMNWILPEDRETVKNHILSGYEKPYEVTALRKDGTTFPAEIQGRMFFYGGKQVRVTALRDITERKQAQKERMEAIAEAAESRKMALVGQVAGKMAHDFNNILGIIMGISELSLMDCKDVRIKETLQIILEQTLRGKNLTKNLVAFAKDQEPKQEYFAVDEKIELVLSLLKKDLDGIRVIREYGPQGAELLADPGMIEHALVNVLLNAIHAVSLVDQPQILIHTSHTAKDVVIRISDNGCGIPGEYRSRIFEPSFTLKGSKDRSGAYKVGITGSGYGMVNVKKYVEKHKGKVLVESLPDQGTCITILIPLIKKELSPREIDTINRSPRVRKHKYVLLVEDEQTLSDIQYRILTQPPFSHRVDVAANGQMAKDLFDRNAYDFISLDYVLPGGISGMDVYRHIRSTDKTVPVLFISGNIEFLESVKELKHNDGHLDHISKPCMHLDYLNAMNRLMGL